MDGDGARVPVTVCDGDVARREGWGRCVWKRKAGEKKLSVQYIKKKKKKTACAYISSSSCVGSMSR